MSQRQLYEQIRRAFSVLTRPPRPQLSERIRDSLWGRPAPGVRTPIALPAVRPVVIGAAASVLLLGATVLLLPALVGTAGTIGRGVSRVMNPPRTAATTSPHTSLSRTPAETPTVRPTPTATPTAAPTATPAPTAAPPTPPVATLPGFSCAAQSGGAGQGAMSTARVGAQSGYDRFVVEFTGPVPQFDVSLQGTASFDQGGGPVALAGSAGILVVLHNATGSGTYGGPNDVKPGYPVIQEARLLSDAQGTVTWGIGMAHAACFHAWVLTGPSRLVVDIAT